MSDHTDTTPQTTAPSAQGPHPHPRPRRQRSRNLVLGAGALGILALGLGGGAAAWSASHRPAATFDASLASTPIAELSDASSIGVTGQVAEIYGNKFVVTDGTSRALVETGRAGEGGTLVSAGETITVQGRFDDGFLHAAAIRHADQRVDELDPPPPAHGRGHGPRHDDRPEAD